MTDLAPHELEIELYAGPFDGKRVPTGGAATLIFPEPLAKSIVKHPLPSEHRYNGLTGYYLGLYRPGGTDVI